MDFTLEPADLESLDDGQKTALVEALLFAVFADDRLEAEELQQFDKEVAKIPWGLSRDDLVARIKAARDAITELAKSGDKQAIMDRIGDVTSKLSALGPKVFRAMAMIMAADDDLTGDEKHVMVAFVTGLGVSGEQVKAIKSDVGRELSS